MALLMTATNVPRRKPRRLMREICAFALIPRNEGACTAKNRRRSLWNSALFTISFELPLDFVVELRDLVATVGQYDRLPRRTIVGTVDERLIGPIDVAIVIEL